jgi:carboxymethylenebutenolidase
VKDTGPVGIIGFAWAAIACRGDKLSGLSAAVGYYGGAIVALPTTSRKCRRSCISAKRTGIP